MIVADTNVWARASSTTTRLRRNAPAAPWPTRGPGAASSFPSSSSPSFPGFFARRWGAERVLSTLESLLRTRGVTVEALDLARQALKATRANGGGFADHLIALVGFANGANQVITFHEKFSRTARSNS